MREKKGRPFDSDLSGKRYTISVPPEKDISLGISPTFVRHWATSILLSLENITIEIIFICG